MSCNDIVFSIDKLKDYMPIGYKLSNIAKDPKYKNRILRNCINTQYGVGGFTMCDFKYGTWFYPKKVIFHDPATIVYWTDGSKTVVKCQEGDTYDKHTGLVYCFAKKALGNNGHANTLINQLVERYSND